MIEEPCPLPPAYAGAVAPNGRPPLRGDLETDVAVIGAGVTGSSAALHLAQAGRRVAVLEGRTIGWGSSGRAYGLIVAYAKHGHDVLLRRFGSARGERLIAALADGPDLVFGLIEHHDIACDVQRAGWIYGAHKPAAAPALRARADYWAARGAPVSYLGAAETAALTGSPRYSASVYDRRSGGLNPLSYTRGLAAAAGKAGAEVFEDSPVTAIESGRHARWRLTTPAGTLEAEQVVHCTNAYTGRLWPGLADSVIPLRAYQLVTEPLSDKLSRSVLPGGQIITDTRHLFSGIRKLPDGRIHLSTDGPVLRAGGKPDLDKAVARLTATFPQLGAVAWSETWTAWVGVTPDLFPKLFRLAEGMWAVLGFSGRGIAFGTILGREIQRLAADPARDDLVLPVEPLTPIRFRRLAPLGALATTAWYQLVDAL